MSVHQNRGRRVVVAAAVLGGLSFGLSVMPACSGPSGGGDNDANASVFNNTTDPTNKNATYLGSAACIACHSVVTPTIVDAQRVHGHAHQLNRVQDGPPTYPEEGTRAGVPNPPPGTVWGDVTYVIGGYTKMARFVDQGGYVLVSGVDGTPTQWNLVFPPNGNEAGFVPYEPNATAPLPYDFSCFKCHTTGARAPDPANPQFQENRPGMAGSWNEPGVMCEACHGPGSSHAPRPAARDIFVGAAARNCGQCHSHGGDPNTVYADGGFIRHEQQWPELLASGGHKDFACVVCHDPHTSANYANGIRNECIVCHTDKTLGFHEGVIFVRGDYVEPLECQSCHMPYATKTGSSATAASVGAAARVGDTRTHIFRINSEDADFSTFFSAAGTRVVKDVDGKAAVTLDFVCLRCHNGVGNAFSLSVHSASEIAPNIHISRP